jgi:putative ABC transport system ATP-binding protein
LKHAKHEGQPVIELQNAKKIYNMGSVEVPALRGVSLKIASGEFVSIVGPSGSGKSTLMHLIGCLDIPTGGKVLLEGQDISTFDESELAEIRGQKIGFVFQNFNLINALTAKENVELPLVFQDVPEDERSARAQRMLEKMGLSARMNHKPRELSGGEQQRVAVARALVVEPSLILADEPTGNLDSHAGAEIMHLLMQLHERENKTIVLVTHESEYADFAERKVHLRDGMLEK